MSWSLFVSVVMNFVKSIIVISAILISTFCDSLTTSYCCTVVVCFSTDSIGWLQKPIGDDNSDLFLSCPSIVTYDHRPIWWLFSALLMIVGTNFSLVMVFVPPGL